MQKSTFSTFFCFLCLLLSIAKHVAQESTLKMLMVVATITLIPKRHCDCQNMIRPTQLIAVPYVHVELCGKSQWGLVDARRVLRQRNSDDCRRRNQLLLFFSTTMHTHTCMCVCMCTYKHALTNTHACMCEHMSMRACVCVYTHVNICMYVCMHVCNICAMQHTHIYNIYIIYV